MMMMMVVAEEAGAVLEEVPDHENIQHQDDERPSR